MYKLVISSGICFVVLLSDPFNLASTRNKCNFTITITADYIELSDGLEESVFLCLCVSLYVCVCLCVCTRLN